MYIYVIQLDSEQILTPLSTNVNGSGNDLYELDKKIYYFDELITDHN